MNFGFLVDHFFELTITGLALGSVYALVALGYTMVYGVLQLINFAHSEVFMYGTFATLWTTLLPGRERRDGGVVGDRDAGGRLRGGHGRLGRCGAAAGASSPTGR